jgi:ubiquinone/menaquinone biosynthesis C-methylase UbiE
MADAYALDNTAAEQLRLNRQAARLRPITERLFRAAGISPGMAVLDVGCGVGDVSIIAAELVSNSGRVIGFDRDARQVSAANARFVNDTRASFVQATIDDPPEGVFDAIVGRFVLMHQPSPDAAIASLIRRLRPGGVVAFVENNLRPDGSQLICWPPTPLSEQIRTWIARGFGPAHHLLGLQLPSVFRRAGLIPTPPYETAAIIYEGRDHAEMWAELIRSMLPTLLALGVDRNDIDIDTLAERLYTEGGDEHISVLGPVLGVWARKPRARNAAKLTPETAAGST